ncbi:hypothetical protein [Rhodoferax sp.]|uniref:hypothetical protein n=1 Tax=Rhodoferax sp. TaxID=50421 RepID=UPI00284FA562|nr:hypothetical protein [Rhodoferax sp.]MDR3370680.1 hypothetical protein [Rhodoferax sp.]
MTEHFLAFKSGKKTCEWRIYGKRWNEKTCVPGREVVLSKGYGCSERIKGVVAGFDKHRIDDPSHVFNRVFGIKAHGAYAACIHIEVLP